MTAEHLDQPSGDSALAVLAVAVLACLIPFLLLENAVQPGDMRPAPTTVTVSSVAP